MFVAATAIRRFVCDSTWYSTSADRFAVLNAQKHTSPSHRLHANRASLSSNSARIRLHIVWSAPAPEVQPHQHLPLTSFGPLSNISNRRVGLAFQNESHSPLFPSSCAATASALLDCMASRTSCRRRHQSKNNAACVHVEEDAYLVPISLAQGVHLEAVSRT
jgi:hypothetical protein